MTEFEQRASSSSKEDHAYFRALEDAFIHLRGAPLLLSPADWQVAKTWRREGIPLELAERVMERIFAQQKDAQSKTGIRSLRYFKTAVERAWRRIVELGGEETPLDEAAPIDVAARLGRLAAALPSPSEEEQKAAETGDLPEGAVSKALEGVRDELASLEGDAQEIEKELARIDSALLDRLRRSLPPSARSALDLEVDAALGQFAERMPSDRRREARRRIADRVLRSAAGLPVLSLFSPEAHSDGDAGG